MSAAPMSGLDIVNRKFMLEYPIEAARVIDELPRDSAMEFLASQEVDAMSAVWRHLSPARADELLPELDEAVLGPLLAQIEPGICAAMLRRVGESERKRYLGLMPADTAAEIEELVGYPPDTAGRIMDSRVMTFRPDQTVASVLEQLRQLKPRGIRKLFLIDDEHRLTGVVDIQDVAVAEPDDVLSTLSSPPRATTSPFESRDHVAEQLKDLSLEVLPVVDVHGRLIGVIRHAELLKTLREETSADIQTMVGVSKEERALSRPWLSARKRLPWMEINLLTAFLAASVVGLFESTIAQFTALAVLLPVVAGQSGNAGAQALAVTMRGLALREISVRQWMRVTAKEVQTGFVNGIAVALTCGIGVYFWSGSVGLVLVIAMSMVLAMIAAGFAGALVPIGLTRIGQDPAQSSSIILTTVTDIAGFFSFLSIATLLAGLI